MDSSRDKKRVNVKRDRLSGLPDDLIHKILSFIGLKDAIGTSALSSRWRSIWTSMPYLSLSSEDFSTLPKFSKFVTHVLSHRNGHAEVSSVNLKFRGKISQVFVKRITNYAFSHNVQQLSVTLLLQNHTELPLSLFTSQSLKHLSLTREEVFLARRRHYLKVTSTLELPALTALYLCGVILCCDDTNDKCAGLFSKCPNLKNLSLEECSMMGSNDFTICHPTISDLTLIRMFRVNVVAPHLKNLSVVDWSNASQYVISAPNLASLVYEGYQPWQLNLDGFRSLEKADIIIPRLWNACDADAHKMVCLLQELHNVQILKLSLEVVELISSFVELCSYQPSPFASLKSLMIYPTNIKSLMTFPESVYSLQRSPMKVTMCTEIQSYFLDSSPSATFTMVLREEIAAKELMYKLRVLLKKEKKKDKANTETNRAHVEQGKPQRETKTPLQVEGHTTQIKNCWENLKLQMEQRNAKACLILSKLQQIEELLTVLPASRRSMIQPCFSSLCAEAEFVNSKMMDCLKMQCDENQSRLSAFFHELATTLDQSS